MAKAAKNTTLSTSFLFRAKDGREFALLWPDQDGYDIKAPKRLFVLDGDKTQELKISKEARYTEQPKGQMCRAGIRYETDLGTLIMFWEDNIRSRFNDAVITKTRLKRDNLRVTQTLADLGVDVVPHPAWRKRR